MEDGKSIYDLLAEDIDFARTVNAVHKSVVELAEIVEQTRATATEQSQTTKEASALLASVSVRVDEMKALALSLDSKLEEMQRLAETYESSYRAYENLKAVYDAFDSRLKALEAGIPRQATVVDATPVQMQPQQPVAHKFKPLPGVDYTEVTSVAKLFAKYNGKIKGPVIVVRTKTYPWDGDYCMAVKAVNHGKAWGVRYKHGEVNSNRPVNADEEDYSMYHGANYWNIVEDFERQQLKK